MKTKKDFNAAYKSALAQARKNVELELNLKIINDAARLKPTHAFDAMFSDLLQESMDILSANLPDGDEVEE